MRKTVIPLMDTYGPKVGICNICGKLSELTDDHTPPKGAIKISSVQMLHIIHHLTAEKPDGPKRTSKNGVKYRTLCARCNNEILGGICDPAFISFVNSVGSFLKTNIALPEVVTVPARPQKIMRSVLGHLYAQGVDRHEFGKDTVPLRDYILDGSLPLPENINIYYWIFPYKNQFLVRDCAYLDIHTGKSCVIWLMKFFPLAFLVTWDQPIEMIFELPNLAQWRSVSLNDEIEIPVVLKKHIPQMWPEGPSEHSITMYGREALAAYAREGFSINTPRSHP